MNARPRPRAAGVGLSFSPAGGGGLLIGGRWCSWTNSASIEWEGRFRPLPMARDRRCGPNRKQNSRGNVVAFGAAHLFLCLDHFHRGGHPGVKSIPRLAQSSAAKPRLFSASLLRRWRFRVRSAPSAHPAPRARVGRQVRPGADEAWLRPVRSAFTRPPWYTGSSGAGHRVNAVIERTWGQALRNRRSVMRREDVRRAPRRPRFRRRGPGSRRLQIPALLEGLLHGAGGSGRRAIERQRLAQHQFAIQRKADQTSQSELLLAQIGLQRVEPLLLALQFHQGSRDIDTGVGAGFFANLA